MQPGNDTTLFGKNFGPSARPHEHTSGDRSVPFEKISDTRPAESSESIRRRVIAAREIQAARFADYPGIHCNAQMTPRLLNQFAVPDEAGLKRLKDAMNRFHLSARAYDRILKVARTIADLEGSEGVQVQHINEAVNYRNLDRELGR